MIEPHSFRVPYQGEQHFRWSAGTPQTFILAPLAGRDALQVQPSPNITPPEHQPRAGSGLSVRGVHKTFRQLGVLRGVDLDVAPSEVVALLGPNGAGKSTLLRIILGTVTADVGTVVIGGHDIRREPQAAHHAVSWVLGDEHGWYWRLTGIENLIFFGMLRGIARREARTRARAELERHGLEGAADRRVGEYSTGMRARLALARACLVPTAVMMLDEPGHGLDAAANERLEEFLGRPRSTAVLVVTHDLELVSRVAHRSVVLNEGVLSEQLAATRPVERLGARMVPES